MYKELQGQVLRVSLALARMWLRVGANLLWSEIFDSHCQGHEGQDLENEGAEFHIFQTTGRTRGLEEECTGQSEKQNE